MTKESTSLWSNTTNSNLEQMFILTKLITSFRVGKFSFVSPRKIFFQYHSINFRFNTELIISKHRVTQFILKISLSLFGFSRILQNTWVVINSYTCTTVWIYCGASMSRTFIFNMYVKLYICVHVRVIVCFSVYTYVYIGALFSFFLFISY